MVLISRGSTGLRETGCFPKVTAACLSSASSGLAKAYLFLFMVPPCPALPWGPTSFTQVWTVVCARANTFCWPGSLERRGCCEEGKPAVQEGLCSTSSSLPSVVHSHLHGDPVPANHLQPLPVPRLGCGHRLPHGFVVCHLHPIVRIVPALPHRWGHTSSGEE